MNILIKFWGCALLFCLTGNVLIAQNKKLHKEWDRLEKEAEAKTNAQEKTLALIPYGMWRDYSTNGSGGIYKLKKGEVYSEEALENLKTKARGGNYGYEVLSFSSDQKYTDSAADYGYSRKEGSYAVGDDGMELNVKCFYTSEMHKQYGQEVKLKYKIIYFKGDCLILKNAHRLIYLARV